MISVLEKTGMINGPTNIVRMEGSFAGIKKIIYIFMDFHMSVISQTRCPNYTSLDLYQYLAINLQNTKYTIDFMFEGTLSDTTKQDDLFKKRYIDEVNNYFSYKFNEASIKKKKGEKVNVRFHYIDIRDNVGDETYDIVYTLENTVNMIRRSMLSFTSDAVDDIKKYATLLIERSKFWQESLFGNLEYDKENKQNSVNNSSKIIKKIRSVYKHKVVHDNMKNLFNHINHMFNNLIDKLNIFLDIINKNEYMINIIQNEKLYFSSFVGKYCYGIPDVEYIDFVDDIAKRIINIGDENVALYANITDLFFLRRFLDKDYVDHTIIYTGAAHSINYIQHLLTKYNFKITNASYSFDRNIERLNEHLKKYDDTADRREYEKNFYAPTIFQCSNIKDFPENFE